MVKRWYADFKRGRTNTNDAERSGRPKFGRCPGKHQKLHKLVLADRKSKLREIAEELKISEGSEFTILHEHLSMRKLCSKWVQRLLTVDKKQYCVDDSEHCFNATSLRKYVTMGETWIHHSGVKSAVNWVDSSWWKPSKVIKDANNNRQGFGLRILGCARYFVNRLLWERKNHQ